MPHITVCPRCGKAYEASSEQVANQPPCGIGGDPSDRWCPGCHAALQEIVGRLAQWKENFGHKPRIIRETDFPDPYCPEVPVRR